VNASDKSSPVKISGLACLAALTLLVSTTSTSISDPGPFAIDELYMPVTSHQSRRAARSKLAADLKNQGDQLNKLPAEPAPSNISRLNMEKLESVLLRQRFTLLSRQISVHPSNPVKLPSRELSTGSIAKPHKSTDKGIGKRVGHKLNVIRADPLARFRKKLASLKSGQRDKPITILHIGADHIANDEFSRGIREALQITYGDAGRGMVVPARAFRFSTTHQVDLTSAGNWRSETAVLNKSGKFGLSGVKVSSRSSLSSMTLTSNTGSFDWVQITVLTGPSQGNFDVQVGDIHKRFDAWAKTPGSKSFRMEVAGDSVQVNPGGGAQTNILNWSLGKNVRGIRYVNLGLVGASLETGDRFSRKLVANDIQTLDPDLIIYGYGTNEGFNDELDLNDYALRMNRFVDGLHAAAPQADLAYIGAASGLRSDGNKACGAWSIPPKMDPLRDKIAQLAKDRNAAFWNWSSIMGGACGIGHWAEQDLANKNRKHLAPTGYRRSAEAFAQWLMNPLPDGVQLAHWP